MKKKILVVVFFCIGISLFGQQNSKLETDTIIRITGKILPVNITTVSLNYVSFTIPGNSEVYRIERKEVQKIIYRTGRVEILNKKLVEVFDESSWEAIWITKSKKDVANMYVRGKVSAKAPPSQRGPNVPKKNASIKLRKEAAQLGATIILVTHRERVGNPGELPGYYMEGIAFANTPAKEN